MKAYSFIFVVVSLWVSSSTAQEAKPVNITLYFESLCGGCQWFIKHQLYPAFQSIGSIMNINLVPYGNADEKLKDGKWVFTCQHGKEECIGNLIETCAIHFYPNVTDFFPFIHCIETSGKIPRKSAPSCAQKFDLDYPKIESCASGDLGNKLEHEMALKTDALVPDHTYVPWITLEGVHTEKIQNEAEDNLVRLICKTYKGSEKPEACQDYLGNNQRCWRNSRKNTYVDENSIDVF